jgi:glycosyltransferase involved in cell wall biosynthesis
MMAAIWTCFWMKRPNVVVATSPQFFCGWAGVFVSFFRRAPLVLEIRDIWPETIEAVGALSNRRLLRLLERMEKWMYRSADHIVPVGNGYRDNIQQKVDIADHSTVITNGVDLEAFQNINPDPTLDDRYNLRDRFVCFYIGTIGLCHGLQVVNRAAKILQDRGRDDICFCIVGDGADRANLEQQTRDFQLEDMVTYTGRVTKQEVQPLLVRADASLIHLRKADLFTTVIPSKIFETMAVGCPMIMGVEGESRDIVNQAQAAVEMEPESAVSLADALEKLADDSTFCKQLGDNGRRYVAQHYDRKKLADDYLKLLSQVAR